MKYISTPLQQVIQECGIGWWAITFWSVWWNNPDDPDNVGVVYFGITIIHSLIISLEGSALYLGWQMLYFALKLQISERHCLCPLGVYIHQETNIWKQQMNTVANAVIDMMNGLCLQWSDWLILTLIKSEETIFKEILREEFEMSL